MQKVINFSGGLTSGLMTIKCYEPGDIVLFTDTKRERKATHKFLNDFEAHEGIEVHRATYTHERSPGLEGFDALTNWKTFLPNRMKRICTMELKLFTARRYLRSIGVRRFENLIGFRADEQDRINEYDNPYVNTFPKFPLNDMGITKEMVNQYWLTKPYTLDQPHILGNCDACFLKGVNALIRIFAYDPSIAEPWIADEKRGQAKGFKTSYLPGITYEEILKIALSQKTLFDDIDITQIKPAYNCSCTT